MVDWLARMEREKSFYCARQTVSLIEWKGFLQHFWMLFSQQDGLPSACVTGLHAPPPDLPAVAQDVAMALPSPLQGRVAVQFHLSAATASVNSLYTGADGHAGKTDFLRQQFLWQRLNYLGIQESRAPEIYSQKDGVLRIGSGSLGRSRHHGVELWVNLNVPYAQTGKISHFFQSGHFQVIHKDPRILYVTVTAPFLHFQIVVGYAPHNGHPRDTREQWWQQLSSLVDQFGVGKHTIFLIDANADPGAPDYSAVFSAGFKMTENTGLLRDFLYAHDLCLPATGDCHVGPSATWTSPDGQLSHCLDHVIIPRALLHACQYSSVLNDLDLGNGDYDHEAVALQLQWSELLHGMGPRPHSMVKKDLCYDRARVQPGDLHCVLSNFKTSTWQMDIETHVETFNQGLLRGVSQRCPRAPCAPKKEFFPPDLWQLRHCKLQFKAKLKDLDRRCRWELLQSCFAALSAERSHTSTPAVESGYFHYATWLRCCRVRVVCGLHQTSQQLRGRLRSIKKRQLQTVFEQLPSSASASTVLHELKKVIGSTNLKKFKSKPLPYIRDQEGAVCISPQVAMDVWISFFQTMEGGRRVDSVTQRQEWLENLSRLQAAKLDLCLTDLPSLTDLETAFRRVRPEKATGPDRVDAFLCHRAPASFAKKTYAMMLKTLYTDRNVFNTKEASSTRYGSRKGPKISAVLIAASSFHRMSASPFTAVFVCILQTFLRSTCRSSSWVANVGFR